MRMHKMYKYLHATRCKSTCTCTARCTKLTKFDLVSAEVGTSGRMQRTAPSSMLATDGAAEPPAYIQVTLHTPVCIHLFTFTTTHSPLYIHLFTYTTFCTTLCMHTLFSTDKHTHYTPQNLQQQRIYQYQCQCTYISPDPEGVQF